MIRMIATTATQSLRSPIDASSILIPGRDI
jgi:hypothetical protein